MRLLKADVLVVGSGAAGMLAASEAASFGCDVVLVSKGAHGRDGATITAQADVAVDGKSCREALGIAEGDIADSPATFAADMLREGEYLGDETLVAVQTESIAHEVARLRGEGLRLRGLVKNPGHSFARGVWISAVELSSLLRKKIFHSGIKILQHALACDLMTNDDGAAAGALFWDMVAGEAFAVAARATILCTGGAMRLYPYATAPTSLTGDGLAMAYRAGAELVDMEFPMFLPYTLLAPKMLEGVTFAHDLAMLTDAHALNRAGGRFIAAWDPVRMERTTRDVNAAAAGVEIVRGRGTPRGGVWLSFAHLPANLVERMGDWLPEGLSNWRYGGFDLKKIFPDLSRDALETIPACHFWNGGIATDESGATSVPGLYAAGEGTGGLHGANRISGNGIGQAIVWGARVGRIVGKKISSRVGAAPEMNEERLRAAAEEIVRPLSNARGARPNELAKKIRAAAWDGIGLVRDAASLGRLTAALARFRVEADAQAARDQNPVWNVDVRCAVENKSLLDVAECVAAAAKLRTESRGAHYREDCPFTEERWTTRVRVSRREGRAAARANPSDAAGRRPYGRKEVSMS